MIDPASTIRALLSELTEHEANEEHQSELVTNEDAIREVTRFAAWVTQAAIGRASAQGADFPTALTVGSESSLVAVLLLGVEYGRILERDQARSLEDMLAEIGDDDDAT